jgi:TRAP-type C4-dicarboxylate transport system permease small subunit
MPAVFLRYENIVVNVVDDLAPRWVAPLKRLDLVLALVVLVLIAWQGWLAAADAIAFNDMTADLNIPRGLHWSALLIGIIASVFAVFAMLWRGVDRP